MATAQRLNRGPDLLPPGLQSPGHHVVVVQGMSASFGRYHLDAAAGGGSLSSIERFAVNWLHVASARVCCARGGLEVQVEIRARTVSVSEPTEKKVRPNRKFADPRWCFVALFVAQLQLAEFRTTGSIIPRRVVNVCVSLYVGVTADTSDGLALAFPASSCILKR